MQTEEQRITLIQKDHIREYHSDNGYISSSGLKTIFKKSPLHYANRQEDKEPTPAMQFGSAYHTFVLEPEVFEEEYFVLDTSLRPEPTKDFRDAKNREWKKTIELINNGKTCLTVEVMQQLEAMKAALEANETINRLLFLEEGEVELSHYTELDGVKVKIRPDKLKKKSVIDLKTTEDASPAEFMKSCYNFGYHISAALYLDVLQSLGGNQQSFLFIAQEKSWPYAAQVYVASESFISQGRFEYTIALQRYREALETGIFKGYEMYAEPEMRGIIELNLPAWAYKS